MTEALKWLWVAGLFALLAWLGPGSWIVRTMYSQIAAPVFLALLLAPFVIPLYRRRRH